MSVVGLARSAGTDAVDGLVVGVEVLGVGDFPVWALEDAWSVDGLDLGVARANNSGLLAAMGVVVPYCPWRAEESGRANSAGTSGELQGGGVLGKCRENILVVVLVVGLGVSGANGGDSGREQAENESGAGEAKKHCRRIISENPVGEKFSRRKW